jgi:hypothetical protein
LTSAILRVRFARKRVTGIDATARASVMSRPRHERSSGDTRATPGRHQGDTRETLRRLEKQLHGPMHLWCRSAARGGREAARQPRSQNSGALGQEIEPFESNAADMGVGWAVDRLLACRRHPPSRAQDGPPLTLSPASFPRAPPFLFPVSPSGPFFGNTSSFDFLFAQLALTLGSRPQQSRLGQTGRQSPAERPALERQSSQRNQVRSLSGTMQH